MYSGLNDVNYLNIIKRDHVSATVRTHDLFLYYSTNNFCLQTTNQNFPSLNARIISFVKLKSFGCNSISLRDFHSASFNSEASI